MYVIVNDHGDILCRPGTEEAYRFKKLEDAVRFLQDTGVKGNIVNLSQTEERYGGQNDLW